MDKYSIFYHKYIEDGKINSGQSLGSSRSFNIWSGFAFENLCIRHKDHIAHALQIGGTDYRVFAFKEKEKSPKESAQIDLIIERSDAVIIIEVKFYNDTVKLNSGEASKIRKRKLAYIEKSKTKKNIFVTLITPYGAERNEHYLGEITNDIVLEELFIDLAIR